MNTEQADNILGELLSCAAEEELGALYDQFCDAAHPVGDAVPSPALEGRMDALLRRIRRSAQRRKCFRYMGRGVVAAALVVTVAGVTMMSVDAWRVRLLNIVLDSSESGGTRIQFQTPGKTGGGAIEGDFKLPMYLPEGYRLTDTAGSDWHLLALYANGDDEMIYEQSQTTSTVMYQNSDEPAEQVKVRGYDAALFKTNDGYAVIWSDGESVFKISGPFDKAETLKIAENVE